MKTNDTSRRVKLRIDYSRRGDYRTEADNFAARLNAEVIPALLAVDETATLDKETVITAAADFDAMRAAYIETRRKAANVDGELLNRIAAKEAAADFDSIVTPYLPARTNHPEFIDIEAGRAVVNVDAIEEAATIYVDGEALEAYDRHQAAVNALNIFFRGNAPGDLSNYFPVVDGKVIAGTTIVNYNQFI